MSKSTKWVSEKLKGADLSVWAQYTKKAMEIGALNLGLGFPDFHPPQFLNDALIEATNSGRVDLYQYTRDRGHPRFVNVIAKLFSKFYDHEINPMSEVLVTVGAYGGLFCIFHGLLNPGDEVIVMEPFFIPYQSIPNIVGATPVFVPLRPTKASTTTSGSDWILDPVELESKFSAKTKLFILNNPHNPVGKVFSLQELEMIAGLCKKYDVVCVADEVYEWLVFEGQKHIKIATLPGMWERTLTVSSAGKTFSATGWRTGWIIGPANLIEAMAQVIQHSTGGCATLLQEAIAMGLEHELPKIGKPECYFHSLPAEVQVKRDKIVHLIEDIGLNAVIPDGGYFIMADISRFDIPGESSGDSKDIQFLNWTLSEKKLLVYPMSGFYSREHVHLAQNYVRICFVKKDSTIDQAEQIFLDWKKSVEQI